MVKRVVGGGFRLTRATGTNINLGFVQDPGVSSVDSYCRSVGFHVIPEAPAPPGGLLERRGPGLHPTATEGEILDVDPAHCSQKPSQRF